MYVELVGLMKEEVGVGGWCEGQLFFPMVVFVFGPTLRVVGAVATW